MKYRNRLTLLQSHFIKLPSEILNLGLDGSSISIYLCLCSFTEEHNPTISEISNRLLFHRNTVCRGLKRLCDAGVIKKVRQGRVIRVPGSQVPSPDSTQSIYEFTSPSSWDKSLKEKKKAKTDKKRLDSVQALDNDSSSES